MRRSILFSYLRGKPVHPVLLTAERESGNLGGIAGGAAGGEEHSYEFTGLFIIRSLGIYASSDNDDTFALGRFILTICFWR